MNWISIEKEMPKSGEFVLVTQSNNKIPIRAIFAEEHTLECNCYDECACQEREDETRWWPKGWYEANHNDEVFYRLDNITHWMLLPAIPSELTTKAAKCPSCDQYTAICSIHLYETDTETRKEFNDLEKDGFEILTVTTDNAKEHFGYCGKCGPNSNEEDIDPHQISRGPVKIKRSDLYGQLEEIIGKGVENGEEIDQTAKAIMDIVWPVIDYVQVHGEKKVEAPKAAKE